LPRTDAERVYTVFSMIVGASIYAYIVGSVCGIVASMDSDRTAFYHMMDGLNIFMHEKRLPADLQVRLREYFRYRRHNRSIQDRQNLLQEMSVTLREEVAAHTHGDWMKTVPIFKGAENDFIVSTTLLLKHQTFSPREAIYRAGDLADRMFIVERGVVATKGRIYTAPKVFGDDGLLRLNGKRTALAITLSYCVTYVLEQQALIEALSAFPDEARKFRMKVTKVQILDGLTLFKDACERKARILGKASIHDLFVGKSGPQTLVMLNSTLLQGICSANSAEDYDVMVEFMLRIERFGEKALNKAVVMLQKTFRGWRERREMARLNPMMMFNMTTNIDTLAVERQKKKDRPQKPRSTEAQLMAMENMLQGMHHDMLVHFSALSNRITQIEGEVKGGAERKLFVPGKASTTKAGLTAL